MDESEDLVEIEPEVEVAEPYNPAARKRPNEKKAAKAQPKAKTSTAPAVATGAALPKVGPALSGVRPAAAAGALPVVGANISGARPGSTTGILPVPTGADFTNVRPSASGILPVPTGADFTNARPSSSGFMPVAGISGARAAVGTTAPSVTAFNPKVTSTNPSVGSQSGLFKRKDPRAQTVIVPKAKEPSHLRAIMVRVMWGSAFLLLLLVASTGAYNLYLHFQVQEQEKKQEFRRSSDMAELLDRMSNMESEIKTQRALIRQQEVELKNAKGELNNYARTNDTLMRKLTKEKAP